MIAERPAPAPSDIADVRPIFIEQRRRYRLQPTMPLEERLRKLDALERAILAHRDDLHAALKSDFKKSSYETDFTELIITLGELRHSRKSLAKWMKPQSVDVPLSLFGSKAEVRYEPKGVVLIMSPWNYPFNLTMGPLIGALAAGNRAIVRPSEKAPATRDVMTRIIADAFDPSDVACVGGEVETAQALLKLPFDHIFYTGSTKIGKLVMAAAAEHLSSVTLELGGKSPCIVAADADVARASGRVAWGKYINAGQTCVAPDYVLVHASLERAFLDGLAADVKKMYGATAGAVSATPDFCRMIDDGAFDRVDGAMRASVAAGARVEAGGESDRAERYIAPTVLSGVGFDSPIMREEIFGPVLPVLAYHDLDDALAQINERPKPLALYAFSEKAATADKILAGTSSGGALVNDTILHLANANLPFGGVGESGIGNYHGIFGFRTFSHERAVMRQTKSSLAPMLAPPYGKVTGFMMKMLERIA